MSLEGANLFKQSAQPGEDGNCESRSRHRSRASRLGYRRHTSVSFTLDRYGHLYPDSYATLRDRLDALHSSAQERDAEVIDLSSTLVRPQRGRNMQ
jgi:hypothetical protein